MATIDKPAVFAAPGEAGSPVSLKARYDNFIGGEWVAPVEGHYQENLSPATGEPFCEVPRSTAADIELALDAAHAAKDAWGKTSATDRATVLNASPTRSTRTSRCSRSRRAGTTASRCARRSPPTSRSQPTTSATSPA